MGYWDNEKDEYVAFGGYDDMVKDWGYEVLVWVEDNDYQGDTHALLRDGERYGYLTFGWGSCSGCDALQACDSQAQYDELNQDLKNRIHWEADRDAMKDYFINRDWEIQWCWHKAEFKEFLTECANLLILGSWVDSLEWEREL